MRLFLLNTNERPIPDSARGTARPSLPPPAPTAGAATPTSHPTPAPAVVEAMYECRLFIEKNA